MFNRAATTIERCLHPAAGEAWLPADITTFFNPATGVGVGTFPAAWTAIADPISAAQYVCLDELLVSGATATGVYEFEIGVGPFGNEVTITAVRVYYDNSAAGRRLTKAARVKAPLIAPGTRVSIRSRCSAAGVQTPDVQVGYHLHPTV